MTLAGDAAQILPDDLIRPSHRLAAFAGAGGKTSLIRWFAEAFRQAGKRVLITTTTKFFPFPDLNAILLRTAHSPADIINSALDQNGIAVVADHLDKTTGKLVGLHPAMVTELSALADLTLVEADGAARKPLKAPAEHEPVIPANTDLCIGVMGLDAAFRPLTETTVHRHETFARIAGLSAGKSILPEHMIRLAQNRNGLFKGCPGSSERIVFLNKNDLPSTSGTVHDLGNALSRLSGDSCLSWFSGSARLKRISRISPCPDENPPLPADALAFPHRL